MLSFAHWPRHCGSSVKARQAVQVVGQAAQGVAGEVEDFQRVGQIENFPGELGQPAGQVQACSAGQLASHELGEGIHAGRGARKGA